MYMTTLSCPGPSLGCRRSVVRGRRPPAGTELWVISVRPTAAGSAPRPYLGRVNCDLHCAGPAWSGKADSVPIDVKTCRTVLVGRC